jgi:hypothetical protein
VPAQAQTVSDYVTFTGTDNNPLNGGTAPQTYTVTAELSGLNANGVTPATDVTMTLLSITPTAYEPQTADGLTGIAPFSWQGFITTNGVVTALATFGSANSFARIDYTLTDGTSVYLRAPGAGTFAFYGSSTDNNKSLNLGTGTYSAVPTAVPAPAALAVFIPALLGLGAVRRRRV